jgi:hypothetical protein
LARRTTQPILKLHPGNWSHNNSFGFVPSLKAFPDQRYDGLGVVVYSIILAFMRLKEEN